MNEVLLDLEDYEECEFTLVDDGCGICHPEYDFTGRYLITKDQLKTYAKKVEASTLGEAEDIFCEQINAEKLAWNEDGDVAEIILNEEI